MKLKIKKIKKRELKYILKKELIAEKSIEIVADIVGQKLSTILNIIKHKGYTINKDSVLNEELWNILKDYLSNAYKLKLKHSVKKIGGIKGINKKSEKRKPSYGKEGNYRKLILIRTKT